MIQSRVFSTASKIGIYYSRNTRINTKYVGYYVIPKRHYAISLPPGVKVAEPQPGEAPLIPGTAGIYSMFFFEEAYRHGGDSAVRNFETELNFFVWKIRKDAGRWDVETKSPLIPLEARSALVEKRISSLGLSPFFSKCILTLLERKEISRLNQIRTDYEEIMQVYRREIEVVFTTGKKLPQSELDFYQKTLKLNFLKPSDNMIFTHSIDPTIKRGYTATVAGVLHNFAWNNDIDETEQESKSEIRKLEAKKEALKVKMPTFDHKTAEAEIAKYRDFFPPDILQTTTASTSSSGH